MLCSDALFMYSL